MSRHLHFGEDGVWWWQHLRQTWRRQTTLCYYFSLRLLKVLVISVHDQSVLRWFIPLWQSHDKQTICQASRPYLVFASHAYRDKDCVTMVVWLSERAAPEARASRSRVIYRTEKMGKVNPILFISIRTLQTLSDFVSLLTSGGEGVIYRICYYCMSERIR